MTEPNLTKEQQQAKFEWKEGDVSITICHYCLHSLPGPVCKAFPGGIPKAILMMENDHQEPVDGDNGIQFELKPGKTMPKRKPPRRKRKR